MATMVKDKSRKKKNKEKTASRSSLEREQPCISNDLKGLEDTATTSKLFESSLCVSTEVFNEALKANTDSLELKLSVSQVENNKLSFINEILNAEATEQVKLSQKETDTRIKLVEKELYDTKSLGDTYQDLNTRLERISIPGLGENVNLEDIQNRLENPQAYLKLDEEAREQEGSQENVRSQTEEIMYSIPSAPVFEEEEATQYIQHPEHVIKETTPKIQSMSLDEAVKLYGGTEMERVKALSEKEEAIVEAGPVSGPEHPLVDMLSTFRSSLIAVDRERLQLAKGYLDEEKYRKSLWKVETKCAEASEECAAGTRVTASVKFEHAEFMKDRLPVAKLKLEGLLRDVQDSYCHHQHAALLTYCQIEEFISETIRSNKKEIREALALVLKSLRLSDSAPSALAVALQRWAAVLSAALLDGRDISQLLHLLHHLFRQTRSVRWASRVIRTYIRAGDRIEAAQTIAVLDFLLARPKIDNAVECTEDVDDAWEEMDKSGSGAVCDGALRERDLLALLRGFPLRDLLARLVLFPHSADESDWGDRSGGSGVLKACCGVRALLRTLHRGVTSHHTYTKLHAQLKKLAVHSLSALGVLHQRSRDYYSSDLQLKISTELEACFCAGYNLLGAQQLQELPVTLLADRTAWDYCFANILALHDKSPKQLDFLPIELPVYECGLRVRTVAEAARSIIYDRELARTVMEFLFQTGIKRKPVPCKGACESTARELLPRLLETHAYLHTVAFHTFAEYCQVDPLEPTSLDPLSPRTWRPPPGEVQQLLDDWSARCPQLIQHLLMKLDYKPYSGLSLETQLAIGSWLCNWLRAEAGRPPPPEWAWSVLRRLRVHRTWWGVPPDAPPPSPTPDDSFSMAYAVLASSWGHCIPLICSSGVEALCRVCASRAGEAAHCLGPVMLLMAHSPESVAFTPKFTELFSLLLAAGPTMVQRALGLGPERGADVLLRLILAQVEGNHPGISRSALISAWLHALWKPSLRSSALLDALLLATRDWAAFDAHAKQLLQDKSASEHVSIAVRNVSTAPMVCACVLRGQLGVHEARGVCARVNQVLHVQRTCGDRVHVDNALKLMGANMSAEDLVIYKCATALLSAPAQRPAQLTIWALFFHLYLQRPPDSMTDTTSPCGPLYFSGLIKSRVLAQLRKKLQETITYHHNEVETLKQNHREETPQVPARSKDVKRNSTEDGVLPMLNIRDLSGESSESSESDSENEENEKQEQKSDSHLEKKEELALLVKYHSAAESMCKEYLRWLDEGDKTRAMPHHADIARFLPEQALGAAWSRELSSRRPPAPPEEPSPPATPTPPRASPSQCTVTSILLAIKDCSSKRSRRISIKSPLEDTDFKDPRTLLRTLDKHLANMEALAEEWCNEVARLASLDSALWELVSQLRVRKQLPPVRKKCAHKDCEPVTIHVPHYEWCISLGAESGIDKNRQTARALTRRLARPRPHTARSAAALITIARHIRSCEAAVRVVERAWQCARCVYSCAPAHTALTALVEHIADRWLSHNGKICSELLTRWGNNCTSSLQQSLCGALVCPRRLQAAQCVPVYCAVLRARLPPHIAFSYLSKFELSRWVEVAEPPQRRELLEALVSTAQRWGLAPDSECNVLLELLGVHTATLLSPQELCPHITRCAQASVACVLPPCYWSHVIRATEYHARSVPFDQLGHLLRELGVVWWEARSGLKSPQNQRKLSQFCQYATPTAEIMHALIRAFTAAAVTLSYSPERVALYVWSGLQESWGPWVSPQQTMPLLLTADQHTNMLKKLVDSIHQVMLDCPGIEEHLLQRIFEWAVQTYFSAHSASQECRVQLYSLLEELRLLPWMEHQWFQSSCLQPALQACASNSKEIQAWCSDTWRGVSAPTWLRGAADDQLAVLLASLLYLFTSMPLHSNTLEQATLLPWWRLPQAALEEALERFFVQHHNPTLPYHELPQFKVVLFASELRINTHAPPPVLHSSTARHKRATTVSRWVCSACAPALSEHVTSHSAYILHTLTDIAPYLEGSEGELEELLGRAVTIMCIEPAATAALPVWCEWVSSTNARLIAACVSAASILTVFEYFACLADASIRAHCTNKECGGWADICARLCMSPWRAGSDLAARARLHAAYAVSRAHAHDHAMMQAALRAVSGADINYIENEAIVSVWICVSCRVALSPPATGEGAESGAAARALLARAGAERARSLLKIVTMQADTSTFTPQHRLLSRLALCIVSPSENAIKAYEAACSAVLGSDTDVVAWGRTPKPKHLPRLAIRLFPNAEKYFKDELDMAPEE